jgi:hypothetical protein
VRLWERAFFAVYLAVQLSVPAWVHWRDSPRPFGWRMYTGAAALPEIELESKSGSRRRLAPHELRRYVLRRVALRGAGERFAAHLCERIPDLSAVHLATEATRRRIACPPG